MSEEAEREERMMNFARVTWCNIKSSLELNSTEITHLMPLGYAHHPFAKQVF